MAQAYLSLDAAKRSVVSAVEDSKPGKRNPSDGSTCLYTDPDDPSCHCIVGQVLVDNGIPLPPREIGFQDHEGAYIGKGYMGAATASFLTSVQKVFDGPFSDSPPTWRQALKEARKKGLFD